ncbi:uncharacterized protein [Aristolochia californica]|uniref:uncharacterized protein n=1 Tax=Aristolochia californica TaxID=171875 RepID=UPI0035DE2E5D
MATALFTSGSRREGRSGSRRETVTESLKCRKIGCMSGILHLLHSPSRKRLTLAKNQDKTVISSTKSKPPSKIKSSARTSAGKKSTRTIRASDIAADGIELRRFSCDVPRSPTITPAIRRCNSINSSETLRRPPALVAQLMGLDDFPAEDSTAEKRRKLITALQKCDADLKDLKRIIETARQTEDQRRKSVSEDPEGSPAREDLQESSARERHSKTGASLGSSASDMDILPLCEKSCGETNSEQPSPVSVHDGAIFSPDYNCSPTSDKGDVRCTNLKEEAMNRSFFHRDSMDEPSVRVYQREEDEPFKHLAFTMTFPRRRSNFWGSKEMIETVNKVWKDGIWEEKWELGKICISMEDHIFGGLVEEMITELGYSIPLDKWRHGSHSVATSMPWIGYRLGGF